ncbi:hypothetical protein Taro_047945, partial [Colocasia esculenta]|nr:hypothetical protein [Colocasia esculenta]
PSEVGEAFLVDPATSLKQQIPRTIFRSEKLASISLDAGISVGVHGWTLTPHRRHAIDANMAFGQKELRPESLKVLGIGLQQCGLQVWCWLVSTVLWLVLVEWQLDLLSVTVRLRGLAVGVCPGGGTILVVVSLWYLMVVGTCTLCGWFCVVVLRVPVPSGVEVDLCSVGVCGMAFHVL